MAPSPFRATAVTCTVLVATLGAGLAVPLAATAATATTPSSSSTVTASPIDDIPVDTTLTAPHVRMISSTVHGSSIVMGTAAADDVYLLAGDVVVDRWPGSNGLFQLVAQDKYKDVQLDMVRVHEDDDGSQTRTDRIQMPRTLQVNGLLESNTFTPGVRSFAGSGTAGATVTATDATGEVLFSTTASSARSTLGTWAADATLAGGTDHDVTFRQTTADGRTTVLSDVVFRQASNAAPVVESVDRRLDGGFAIDGRVDGGTTSVTVRSADGTQIASNKNEGDRFHVVVPAAHVGETVAVVAHAGDDVSEATMTVLTPLPVDSSVAQPALRAVHTHVDGAVQIIGEPQQASAIWVMDGDRVVASFGPTNGGWSYLIREQFTGKQLDLVQVSFDGQRLTGMSERVALPRLLKIDDISARNTYLPGKHTFTGSAEAGATITATDQDGKQLFSTEAKGSRAGVASWSADAALTSRDGYELTFTQTTTDGRASVMRDIAFTAEDQDIAPVTVATKTVTPGISNTVVGTATPGATFRVLNPSGTQIVPGTHRVADNGTWSFDRVVSKGATKLDIVIEQTVNGTAKKSGVFTLTAN